MFVERLTASAICGLAQLVTGVRAVWRGCTPEERLRVYYANHSSHTDFVLIWAALPPTLRRQTRPVAGSDYWLKTPLRRFIVNRVFRAVLVDRSAGSGLNPVGDMAEALAGGDSLIVFPEGTRHIGDELLPFKSGIYHLAQRHPEVEFVPVWNQNLGRVMPKGTLIPVPLLCTLSFGQPVQISAGETRESFLKRCRDGLLALAPPPD